jgi:hypothetical protein
MVNQGYIRRWIGEVLLARGEYKLAGIFLEAARVKWEQVSPPKAGQVVALKRQIGNQIPDSAGISKEDLERTCLDWISGRLGNA